MKAEKTVLLVAVDPLMGGLAGDTEPIRQLGDRVVVQSVIFEETLSLFAHGNTSPGHGRYLRRREVLPMSWTRTRENGTSRARAAFLAELPR